MRLNIDFERISYEDLDSAYHQIRREWIKRTMDKLTLQIQKGESQYQQTALKFYWHDIVNVFDLSENLVFTRNDTEEWRR